MEKDFDQWNTQKKALDRRTDEFFFKQGEIWWCSVGLNVAIESCGKGDTFRRPVLVLKKLSHISFIGIPLSTKQKQGTWFAPIPVLGEVQCALLYQIRMFSINRLQRRLTTLEADDFTQIKRKLAALLKLS
jgi:mRNA interferase MazF